MPRSLSGLLCCLVLVLAPAGCSLLEPTFTAPKLSIVAVQLLRSDLWHQELKVRMQVDNPNDRELPVKGITYSLDLDGQEFAHGESAASFVVPALGQAEFDMSMSANMAGVLIKLLGQGGSQIEYHLTGRIALSQGLLRSIPFDEHGSFRLQ